MNKFDNLYNKIISEANINSSSKTTRKPKLNLADLTTKLSNEFGLECEKLTGKNTKGFPLQGNFCGKAYGDGYSINIMVDNGNVYVNPDGSSEMIFLNRNKSIYNNWLNKATEAAKKYQIKFADFYISKD
jgi:hypothetical protein